MNNLKKDFIERTLRRLEDLSARAGGENLSPEFLREILRTLHTIKGTSQTFGFSAASDLAHELEDLLAGKKTSSDLKPILIEGFQLLAKSFELENVNENTSFLDKISQTERRLPAGTDAARMAVFHFLQVPAEISGSFADFEKKALSSAMAGGKAIFRVQAGFDLKDFTGEYKKLRERLSSQGEIIATLPGEHKKGKIEFAIYLAADDPANLAEIAENFSAEIDWQSVSFEDNSDNLSRITEHAETLAKKSGKEISLEISADKFELAREKANLVFDVLLHLVRNAVDHGIETPEERIAKNKSASGTIEIALKVAERGLVLSVRDDGKGIDLEKLRAKAIEKNLAPREKNLTENELLDLIFLHDFSTRETATEISGRGVGLDAVKTMVENAGGTRRVESRVNVGTTFEIFLPNES